MEQPTYSVVIPVYNSEGIVAETVARVIRFFEGKGYRYDIVLVNDGSKDNSWSVISECARQHEHVKAINFLKNYGQHNANFCGFKHAKGDFVITMDDDLQNPPEEIEHLIETAKLGHDLVIGRFISKQHELHRRVGSKLIGRINREIFGTPDHIVLSNFRLISRAVIDRVCSYKTSYPYVPGLVVMFSHSIANVDVEHHPRTVGQSNYNLGKILTLVATILFNYSSFPLRFISNLGLGFSLVALLLGLFYLVDGLIYGTSVPGWPTIVVLLALFNAFLMAMMSMLGEYIVRLINQTSYGDSYVIKDQVD